MSTPLQSRISSTSFMAFDETFILPLDYSDDLNLGAATLAMQSHPSWLPHWPLSRNTPPLYDAQCPLHINHVHNDVGVHASAHGTNVQTPYHVGLWNSHSPLPVAEVLLTPCATTAVDGEHGHDLTMASCLTYDPGRNLTHLDNRTVSETSNTLWPISSNRPSLSPFIDHGTETFHHYFLDQAGTPQSNTCSSHATHHHYQHPRQSIAQPSPLCQPFSPTSSHVTHRPMPTRILETGSRSSLTYVQDSTGSSRLRRAARAIKYEGLWIDEEELFRGLMKPDGKLTVHQCRWEEDHSPCHLWIASDKSCINTHIQKWHGGKPGGDKVRVDCHWADCRKAMMKESITRHIVTIHLGEMWECLGCGKGIVRNDAYRQHAAKSNFASCRTSGALITYPDVAREIDARAALESGASRL